MVHRPKVPAKQVLLFNSENIVVCLYILKSLLQVLKKCLIMISGKQSIIYVGELEIYAVSTYHRATFSVWPGPLFIVLNKSRDIPVLDEIK